MRLAELIPVEIWASGATSAAVEISSLAYDSRRVRAGALFFCVPGERSDGHDFAEAAVAAGAVALVVERPLGLGVPEIVVESVRGAMGPVAGRFFGEPSAGLRVVGVTGTNGKTTTAFLVRQLLEAGGERCGLLGTVTSVVGGRERPVSHTTPEAIDLQADLRGMLDGGEGACAMEVSSHALELGRVAGVRFAAAIFTNLTQDHLDFHADMEAYFQAKRGLFVGAGAPGIAVINVGDPYGRRLAGELPEAVTFAVEDRAADYRACDLRCDLHGCRFTLHTPVGVREVALPLPGRFNVANALGALAAAHALGGDLDVLVGALERGVRVPGRLEPVDEGQGFAVLVDYAHTPDSLENVLRAARELIEAGVQGRGLRPGRACAGGGGRVVCVFGAGGDRDRGKRPLMGEAAAGLADVVVVTSDNPRTEDPEAIVAEILVGAERAERPAGAPPVVAVTDRRAAIELAIAQARSGDVVVIAGKGHEQGQELAAGRRVAFDDVTVAREALRGADDLSPPPPPARSGMIGWEAARVAEAAGARLLRAGGDDGAPAGGARAGDGAEPARPQPGPRRVSIDSREVGPGDLFVGLRGEHVDGGTYAAQALAAGAWGVLVADEHAEALLGADSPPGALLSHPDPLSALQALARAWREELRAAGARVVAVTGSTGKTSTKDILAALLDQDRSGTARPVVASPENLNTEIGLPLALLAAPAGTRTLVLELAMRGAGQISQLVEISRPQVGVIVNVGPVHLELLGSLEAIAAAKAELIAGMEAGGTVVVPAGESLLAPHLRGDLRTITFGEGGDLELLARGPDGEVRIADRTAPAGAGRDGVGGAAREARTISLRPSFAQSHNLRNLLAAVAAARALGIAPGGSLEVRFSALRGERIALGEGIVLINDCYNANPMSMRAALDDLADTAPARRVAVLGDMLELGPRERELHRELAGDAQARGVHLLVAVGPLAAQTAAAFPGEAHHVPDADSAAQLLGGLLEANDTVLVKGSRGVGLERVAERLASPVGLQPAAGGR